FWDGDARIPNLPDPKSPGNTAPTWILASSGEGAIDIRSALKTKEPDVIAYAAGTLKVPRGGKYLLLLGTDDGVRVMVDGKNIFTRDEARPERRDDDLVPIDLTV